MSERAFELGYAECARTIQKIVTSVLHPSGGSWVMGSDKTYLSAEKTQGDWEFVTSSVSMLVFGNCSTDCSAPCPVVGVNLFGLGTSYYSCPRQGTSTLTVRTVDLPKSVLVRSVGTDDAALVYINSSSVKFVASDKDAAPAASFSVDITNDL